MPEYKKKKPKTKSRGNREEIIYYSDSRKQWVKQATLSNRKPFRCRRRKNLRRSFDNEWKSKSLRKKPRYH